MGVEWDGIVLRGWRVGRRDGIVDDGGGQIGCPFRGTFRVM